MKKVLFFLFGLTLFSPTYGEKNQSDGEYQSPSPGRVFRRKENPPVGNIGPDGKMIIYWIDKGYQTMDGSYAYMIYQGRETEYIFYSHPDKKISKTKSLNEFLGFFSVLPKGEDVFTYSTCAGPTYFNEVLSARIEKTISQKGLILRRGSICTCRD